MYAIEVEGLHKNYRAGFRMRKLEVVKDLSLRVREGEIYGFIGPNGAGKTTTIKILVGLAGASAGVIRVFGQKATGVAHKSLLGFLPERPYFYEYLTAGEFLDFYGQLFNIPSAVRRRRSEDLLERVNLAAHRDTPLHKFSKGMLQRVGIAQALVNDPRLVILDEPMSGLDPLGRMLIRDIIVGLRTQGKTVFFSSHILSDVELICDRVGVIVGGRRKGEGTVDELLAHKAGFVEIVARPAPGRMEQMEQALRPLAREIRREGDKLLVRVGGDNHKGQVIHKVIALEGDIESVVPRRESLEDLFMDELAAVKKTGAGG